MTTPDENYVQIIDEAFFIHLRKNLSANFGRVATYLFKKIIKKDTVR